MWAPRENQTILQIEIFYTLSTQDMTRDHFVKVHTQISVILEETFLRVEPWVYLHHIFDYSSNFIVSRAAAPVLTDGTVPVMLQGLTKTFLFVCVKDEFMINL
jgi:hypothetical protein